MFLGMFPCCTTNDNSKMPIRKFILMFCSTLFLSACQSAAVQSSTPEVASKPTQKPNHSVSEFIDSDLLYNYLVGEIGARAGELPTALDHYLAVIQDVDDPYAAERAARIALHLEDYPAGLQAVEAWLQFAPKSLSAHQFSAILNLRTGKLDQAQAQFEILLDLVGDANKSSLLLVASALKEEPNKPAVLQLMRNMLLKRPNDAHAHYAVGAIEAAQKLHQAAEKSLRRAIELKVGWSLPHLLLGEVLVAQGKQEQALQHLRNSVQQYPEQSVLRHAYARQLINVERFDQALPEFRQLHQQNPQNAEISYGLAILTTQQEAWDEARDLWQALRSEPKFYADATYFLGQVEEATDNIVLAIGLYNSVTSGDRRVDAVIRSSNLLAQTQRLMQARAQLQQLRADYPKDSVDIYLAEGQILAEQLADAEQVLAVYTEALTTHPENNDLQYSRGLYLANQARYTEMEADFLAVLERDTQHAETLNALGYTLADQNIRLDEALDFIQRALELRPNDAAVLDSMGWVQYRLGNLDKAADYLHRALASMLDEEIAAHLGEVLWMQGKRAEAREIWQKILQEKPDSQMIKDVLQRLGATL